MPGFSRIESGELELEEHPFGVRECIEGALGLVAVPAGTRGLELVLQVDGECPEVVVGDPTRWRQVLVNLLGNAVKFTSAGEVVVTLAAQPEQDGRVALCVTVRDTGSGIPQERLDRLFRSFSQVDSSITRTHGGSGLGLVISRRLARGMGGDLTVTSAPGVGSSFVFTSWLRAGGPGPARSAVPLSGLRVLLVDDNDSSRDALRQLLTGWGAVCTSLAGAAPALALLAGGTPVDLALVDLAMPGTDGVLLEQALRELPSRRLLPVVLMTSPQWNPPHGFRDRFAGTISKPVRAAALLDKLRAAAGRDVPQPPPAAPAAAPGRPLTVLLAEDNPVNQRVAQLMLDRLGHRVDTVCNGVEAVAAARRTPYDVVLMDVQMPVLDGLRATQQIRAEASEAGRPVIIAVTASVLVEDRAACRRAGMDDYLRKPMRGGELAAALARVPGPRSVVS